MSLSNNCRFIGRISKAIETHSMANGSTMAKISLAVQRDYKNAEGEYDTDFINLVAFSNNADFLLKYADKGDEILVDTTCRPRSYENTDGRKMYVVEFVIEGSKILRRANKTNNNSSTTNTAPTPAPQPIQPKLVNEDDLPF